MSTVRGESNFFVHVVVVVQNANTSCKLLEHNQQKKEKKSEIFFSLFLLCERGVLDKIQFEEKKKFVQRTCSFDFVEDDRLTADGLECSNGRIDTTRQQVLRFLEDLLRFGGFKSRFRDVCHDFLLMATLSRRSDGGRRGGHLLSGKLGGNVRGNGKHILCLVVVVVVVFWS